MKQLELFPPPQTSTDICESRHGGDPNSRAAHQLLSRNGTLARQRALVLGAIRAAGPQGITCAELAAHWGVGLNRISGRFTELVRDGKAIRQGRRNGGHVHIKL